MLTNTSALLVPLASTARRSISSSAKRTMASSGVPHFIYGTAWKKDKTKDLVKQALQNGFRAIDTAAQPRHYQEQAVGEGLRDGIQALGLKRVDIHVQTKYTSPAGQDPDKGMPYDPSDPLETQVRTSVASSLKNLRPDEESEEGSYVDCLLLHSPLPTVDQTLQAWEVLESYVPDKIRALGISNVTLPVLQAIHRSATVKPSVVQNRFYPQTNYDVPLRAFCRDNEISYQSFWTLTGNPHLAKSGPVAALVKATHVGHAVALYALVLDLGILVLNGTTSTTHMQDDLTGINKIQEWAAANEHEWLRIRASFFHLIEGQH